MGLRILHTTVFSHLTNLKIVWAQENEIQHQHGYNIAEPDCVTGA